MNALEFQNRTKAMAVRVIRLTEALPNTRSADVIGRQLLRSATSTAANYRAACTAKSKHDMINKLRIVQEEADETMFWLELIIDTNTLPLERINDLQGEVQQILKMTIASINTLSRNTKPR